MTPRSVGCAPGWRSLSKQGDPAVGGLESLQGVEAQGLPLPGLAELQPHPVPAALRLVEHLHQRAEGRRVHVLQLREVEHQQPIAFAPAADLHGRVVDCSKAGFLTAMEISCWSFIRMAKLAEPLMKD
ncbi:MAG: SDR family oxidoreductase, partial [Myxococcales bacterium]